MPRPIDRPRSFIKLAAGLVTVTAVTVATLVATTMPAAAFKPYTHNVTAENAYDDATDDGFVTVNGDEYAVRAEIVTALRNQPAAYNAGVIGPDGFPDLAYGQSAIHPEETGKWLDHLLSEAWDAQNDAGRTAAEKEQILAFAYGFMTHAAGDMWAHTLINQVAQGVFPGVGEILDIGEDPTAAEIALRHVIAEGYVGDATAGYDGNPLRSQVPGENDETGPEFSDDATPAFAYAAPTGWIYETLVNPANPLPVGTCGDGLDDDGDGTADDGCPGSPYTVGEEPEPNRGPLIDYFIDLKAELQIERAKLQADLNQTECLFETEDCVDQNKAVLAGTVRGNVSTSIPVMQCIDYPCAWDPIDGADDEFVNPLAIAYLDAWIDDIDRGLQHWPELGEALSRTLFDAGTFRDAQNFLCDGDAEEGEIDEVLDTDRAKCEDGIGILQVAGYTLGGLNDSDKPGFINEYLLSMLGAPDFVGEAVEEGGAVFLWLQDLMQTIMPDIDFLDPVLADAKVLLLDLASEALGFDVEQLSSFLKHPTYWMEVGSADIDVPFSDNPVHVDLFEEGDREYLDAVMGLHDPLEGDRNIELPDGTIVEASILKDSAQWDLENFEPAYDAVQTSKLLLLDANGLNQVIADNASPNLLPSVSTAIYADPSGRPANIMVDGLDGQPWLRSIDSDHSWRADRLPVFNSPDPGHHSENEAHYAGTGQMPMWESCIARPAFREIFRDWENGAWYRPGMNFPDLGDAPTAPAWLDGSLTADVAITGSQAVVGGVQWVGIDHTFTLTAADESFTPESLTTTYAVYPFGSQPQGWTTVEGPVAEFALPADASENVPWVIDWKASSECQNISGTQVVRVDRTAPVIALTEPAATGYDTDDMASVQYTITDAHSGVETQSVQFDGTEVPTGYVLDMFTLDTGAHAAEATATDFVDNTATATRAFTLLATTQSLSNNLTRAVSEGLVTDTKVVKGLRDKLNAALKSHATAKHPTEVNQLGAVVEQLEGQLGKGVDSVFGTRMIGWANDLIAVH
ncbi:hypothetical protein [Microbacterium sp. 2FI]|uniref:hypothetical protein n=1 Tax=Microbacterium sp. 2FI TaxID=2502193 RepID=UPI0010F90FF0|nr:hypothetical protein [Microbacterium sp. 2FI]